jgi:hypothetical protein
VHIGDVLVAGQRMTDQDRIGALRIELAIGLIGDLERTKFNTGIEFERPVTVEMRDERMRIVRLARAIRRFKRGLNHSRKLRTDYGFKNRGLDRTHPVSVNVFFDFAGGGKHK